MKNLSKIIREATDHTIWYEEVEHAAESAGLNTLADRQEIWQAMSDMLDSVAVLAFEHRLNSEIFIPALKEWHMDQRTKMKVLADLTQQNRATPVQILIGKLTFRLLGQVEFAFEQHELHVRTRDTLLDIYPPRLNGASSQQALEISTHLRKAVAKLKNIEKTDVSVGFEFEVYRKILESAARHFEVMSGNSKEETRVEQVA